MLLYRMEVFITNVLSPEQIRKVSHSYFFASLTFLADLAAFASLHQQQVRGSPSFKIKLLIELVVEILQQFQMCINHTHRTLFSLLNVRVSFKQTKFLSIELMMQL